MSRFEDFKIEFGVLTDFVGDDDEVVVIPNGVTEIAGWGFQGCNCVRKIVVPASVRNIDEYAFVECHGLRDIVVKHSNESFFSVDGCLFSKKPKVLLKVPDVNISHFKIPKGVTAVGNSAFLNCEKLQELVLPEGVTEIGEWAFFGCCCLKKIVIPESLCNIGDDAFNGCDSLKIFGKTGSFAEVYAKKNHLLFESI